MWDARSRSVGGTHDSRAMVRLLAVYWRCRNGRGNRRLLVAVRQLVRLRLWRVVAIIAVVVVAVAWFQADRFVGSGLLISKLSK